MPPKEKPNPILSLDFERKRGRRGVIGDGEEEGERRAALPDGGPYEDMARARGEFRGELDELLRRSVSLGIEGGFGAWL